MNVHPHYTSITANFLSNRKISLTIANHTSKQTPMSGCSQGSILSSLLWNEFLKKVLELPCNNNCSIQAYADDLILSISHNIKIAKYFNLLIDYSLTWKNHISRKLNMAIGRTWGLHPNIIRLYYNSITETIMLYGIENWGTIINKPTYIAGLSRIQRTFFTEKKIGCKFNELDLLKKVSWFNGKIVKATNFFTNLTTVYFVDSLIQQTYNC